MTERLTRAHRREIENKTHQKIDLDNLAKINVDQLVSSVEGVPPVEEIKEAESAEDKEGEENSSEDQEESEDDSEEESEEEEEEESDDEDLEALLNKAQEALQQKNQTANMFLEKEPKPLNTKLSQMNIGISVDKELYFKTHSGRSKLVTEAVELLGPGEKASKKATVVLKPSKEEEAKKLNKKERQLVSFT